MFTTSSGYSVGGRGSSGSASIDDTDDGYYWSLAKCKRAVNTYLDSKRLEIDEQIEARRYRHGVQWTEEQVKVLNNRKQPVVTYNRIGRKVDGIVGLVERLKQDPKAYPRTPQHQKGADLATAILRFLCDENDWNAKTPLVMETAAIDGIGGIKLGLEPADRTMSGVDPAQPDMDATFEVINGDEFFYDPRSAKHDFSDARFVGEMKWIDEEQAVELHPNKEDEIRNYCGKGDDLTTNSDRDNRWFEDAGDFKRVRIVEIWYKHKGGWCWKQFIGGATLRDGKSPYIDEEDKAFCPYIMFSAAVDHEGDRYGFVRNLKSAQDEINQRGSKALHEINTRRIRATQAAIQNNDIERLRREAARPDGILLSNTSIDDIQFDDAAKQAAVMGQMEMRNLAVAEIENFGPNPAVLGSSSVGQSSGRAIALLQQAGIAELGPYMVNQRGWKIRVYRALFHLAQKYWTNERWIRVTDDQDAINFVGINQLQVDPMTGMPTIANAIGELDVDIILDEGPDTVTIMQDTYEALSQALPAVAPMLTPDMAAAALTVLVETSPLPEDAKKQFRDAKTAAAGQTSPEQQKMLADMQMKQADQQMKMQDSAAQLDLKRQTAAADIQQKREEGAVKLQIAREEADNDMRIEWAKAKNAVRLEKFKAANQAHNQRMQAMGDVVRQVIR